MNKLLTLGASALLSLLAACGGGGDSAPGAPAEGPRPAHLVVIGNSIARHGPAPDIGWTHDSGMAASSASTDYAHLVAAGLGIASPTVINFADLERNPLDVINAIDTTTPLLQQIAANTSGIDERTAVVVQLSDNAPVETMPDFSVAYADLLVAAAKRQVLVCVGSFWFAPEKDAVVKAACEANGGRYVYIGDLRTSPANRDQIEGPQYSNAAVQSHPHDWSMARIAERVLAALER